MASIREGLERRLAAVAATVAPRPMLELERLSDDTPAPVMRTAVRSVDGVRIRYAVSDGPAERTVLLTSPWRESIDAFAPIWPALAGRFRLLAVDLPGVGASEARAEFSPRAMGMFLIRLIDDWALDRPHLVAPDAWTAAALFAALLSPASVTTLVVGSDAAAVPTDLARRLNEIEMPVMVFAGSRDRVVPTTNAEFLARRLRNCQLAVLGAGHCVWREAPDAFAQLLGRWFDDHR